MTFLVFEWIDSWGRPVMRPTGETFRLGGYNLLYESWLQKGRPIDEGWHTTADELIRLHSDGAHSHSDRSLIIDFDPNATWHIGLIELLSVHAFTWGVTTAC